MNDKSQMPLAIVFSATTESTTLKKCTDSDKEILEKISQYFINLTHFPS